MTKSIDVEGCPFREVNGSGTTIETFGRFSLLVVTKNGDDFEATTPGEHKDQRQIGPLEITCGKDTARTGCAILDLYAGLDPNYLELTPKKCPFRKKNTSTTDT